MYHISYNGFIICVLNCVDVLIRFVDHIIFCIDVTLWICLCILGGMNLDLTGHQIVYYVNFKDESTLEILYIHKHNYMKHCIITHMIDNFLRILWFLGNFHYSHVPEASINKPHGREYNLFFFFVWSDINQLLMYN